MMAETVLPPNVREFNEISGVIFARLYESFPVVRDIDAKDIAKALGHNLTDTLPSGRSFHDVLIHTIGWLTVEGFVHRVGVHAMEKVMLTTKALAAMNAIPEKLGGPRGSQLVEATKEGASEEGKRKIAGVVGELFGSAVGGVIKTLGSGS
jgi:hypothetical protein